MAERYTIRHKSSYGGDLVTFRFTNLDEALLEFFNLHVEGIKVQLTADEPPVDDDPEGEWNF